MTPTLLFVQTLNGLQFGLILFLIAAGLTLVFGVMDFINLAHGVQYMVGAYLMAAFTRLTGNFGWRFSWRCRRARCRACCSSADLPPSLRPRSSRSGPGDIRRHPVPEPGRPASSGARRRSTCPVPEWLSGSVGYADGLLYPVYRLAIIGAGLTVALPLYLLVNHTRIGMLVRAGATNAPMVSALGVDIRRLFMLVFGFGAMLAGFAGAMVAPILSVEPGMGDNILILAFVVIVIGGIGSIRGAFVAALMVGLVDNVGRSFAPNLLRLFLDPANASKPGAPSPPC